jgi:hypothetical protein
LLQVNPSRYTDGHIRKSRRVSDNSPEGLEVSIMNKNAQMELVAYNNRHNLPYYDKLEFDDDGWLVTPPADHRLSDALVFFIIGQNLVVARNRHGKWPSDFNSDGDLYPDRWPQGDPVIIWAHGIPFVPVFSDYYALVGSHLRVVELMYTLTWRPGPTRPSYQLGWKADENMNI